MSNYIYNNKAVYLLQYHIVWAPKYRRHLLVNKIKDRLESIIKEVCAAHSLSIRALKIMPDHVHLFIGSDPRKQPYKIVKAVKGRSSNLLRKEFPELLKMPTLWTRSYFIATAGNVSDKTIQRYIEDQWKK